MIIGIVPETFPDDRRVAIVPADVPALLKAGFEVIVATGAGEAAGFRDTAYVEKGARLLSSRREVFATADVLPLFRTAGANPQAFAADLDLLSADQIVVGFLDPLWQPQMAGQLARRGVTALSMELMPRISRAQTMDALSSLATILGYKAVLLAANSLPRLFPMLITSGGTIAPARLFVIGAGVAGLQAIATARRLGAVVEAYDVRPSVKEEVESLGARFVELPLETADAETTEDAGGYAKIMDEEFYRRQQELMASVVGRSDIVITTAAVPGRRPPLLITAQMVSTMRPGSVIVDLAAEWGGNCQLTCAGETVVAHGVTILGPVNLTATVPHQASQLYSRNITNFFKYVAQDGRIQLNQEDEIIREMLVSHEGAIVHPRVKELGVGS